MRYFQNLSHFIYFRFIISEIGWVLITFHFWFIGYSHILMVVLYAPERKCSEVQYTYSNANKAISLTCNFSEEADRMRWFFQKDSVGKETIAYDNKIRPYEGYVGDCDGSKRYCNLIINVATMDMVGRYRFEFGAKGEDPITGCTHEVIIGNLECTSNIRNNHIVGESDCPVKPETIITSCSFHHRGKIGDHLRFLWLKRMTESTILRHKILTGVQEQSEGYEKVLSVKDNFPAANDLQGAILECSLEGHSQIAPCKLAPISVQYAQTPEESKLLLTNSNDFSNNSCVLKKSQSLECLYYWLLHQQDVEYKIQSQYLSREHLVMSGDYKCMGSCQFVTGEICQVAGKVISFSGKKSCSATGYIVVIIILCLMFLALLTLAAIYFKRKYEKLDIQPPLKKQNQKQRQQEFEENLHA